MSPSQRAKLEACARSLGIGPHQLAVGLKQALWEAGPNPVTDFADALVTEGKPPMPPQKKEEWEALRRFRDSLTQFLSGKPAAFIGGIAVRSFGGRAGATIDYDLLIEPGFLQEATAFLEQQGGELRGTAENTYLFHIAPCAISIDLRVARTPLDQEAFETAQVATFMDRKLKVVSPASLAAMKVKAYSERKDNPVKGPLDKSDVQGLIACGAASESEVRDILNRHRPDLLPTLGEILK